ncbi:hypothetical protein ES703_15499 [subsurface metagenome]
MDQITQDWILDNTALLSRLSEIEPKVKFGTIIIRKEKGRVIGLDTCCVTREQFDPRPQKRDTDEKAI